MYAGVRIWAEVHHASALPRRGRASHAPTIIVLPCGGKEPLRAVSESASRVSEKRARARFEGAAADAARAPGQRGIGICQGQLETSKWTLDMQMLSACTDTSEFP